MITKRKIKDLLNPGSTLTKGELIEKVQELAVIHNEGCENIKHIIIGLFIASGLSRSGATKAFEKIQELEPYYNTKDVGRCFVRGEPKKYPCNNCGKWITFLTNTNQGKL